ncbi:DUF5676 family membrane protein [Microbulbifer yueqingensis]|uniref:Uncharacterized protein n=1 Tax=Microbulbifer yueqingensis TaxID=658219 RepID=A0A1G8Y2J8_9GAMM|nr:DUF5676 family membrane protein [Microbulbifer yueqingensis]SDJ97011.1 hypothetical protein SAMN05216212_1333 [Microbulbifer yueqingensis]
MKLNAAKFGLAAAISFGVAWIICALLVMLMPGMMMSMSGHMVHMELAGMGWHLTLAGVLIGLVAWSVSAGFVGWLLAWIYNRLI